MADDERSEEEKLREIAFSRESRRCRGKRTHKTACQKLRRDLRRDDVTRLVAEGKDKKQIAVELGISESTVLRDVKYVDALRLRSMLANRGESLKAMRSRLARLINEMEVSFEISRNGELVEKSGNRPGEQGGPFDETIYKPNEAGDRGYIETIINLQKQFLETLKLEVDPKLVGDLNATPDVWFLECRSKEEADAMRESTSFEDLANKILRGEVAVPAKPEAADDE